MYKNIIFSHLVNPTVVISVVDILNKSIFDIEAVDLDPVYIFTLQGDHYFFYNEVKTFKKKGKNTPWFIICAEKMALIP